ncbi:tetratricopeptide repeat protein 16 isoform X3 [Marmota marmota marmota]|uniref:tetratricopeptide repeat protein 16 isoform X3 n=1 Tax=Marmota marmota marmota TaxID=9994 RepID=UPI002093426F|nr:tetratricopeptide repeat protein 16 isoform X3 [Marmota marmota marmota]
MEDAGEVRAGGEAKAKAEDRDALAIDQVPSEDIPKPRVIPVSKGTLKRIFGTSQVFLDLDDIKPKVIKLTVPLKVREYYQRAHQCLEQEDWEMAVLYFSRALHLDPHVGQCLYEQCDYLDALNIFSQGSTLQPDKPCFHYRCIACLMALKRHQDCLSLITKEVKQGTTNADIYILRARLYNFFQKPRLCYRDLRSALLLDPKNLQAKLLLQMMVDQAQQARQDAGILAVQGLLRQALQRIDSAIENNPLDPSLFLFRGTIYRRLQEFDRAVEDLLKALDMLSDDQDKMVQQAQRQLLLTYNDFAVHCYKQGAYQEGVLLLNKALREEQQEKGLYINRGDCFFQLGNLAFAEADYKQALALSPQDKGANMRMGMLQEKMGFCEEKRRQFQKAENHFSAAIQHNPCKAQYYVYRAKSRQLLQDIFGARQDVATALLLNPKQPKLLPLITSLFPGMSVEEVLQSQVAQLARLQLMQMGKSGPRASNLEDVVGMLRERELEREKAKALLLSWKWDQPLFESSKEPEPTPQALQVEPAEAPSAKEEEEAKEKKEDTQELASHKVTSLSEGYLDQTSSGSIFRYRVKSTSDSTMSTICRGYRSSPTTTATPSVSSPQKTPSSDTEVNEDHLSPDLRKTQASPERRQRPSKAEATQDQIQSSSKTPAAQSQRCFSRKTAAIPEQSQKAGRTEATQGPKQRPKTKGTRSPRQRLRRTKAARDQSWRPGRDDVPQDQSWGLIRNSSKIQVSQDVSKTMVTQDQSGTPSKTEAALSATQSTGSSSSKTYSTMASSPRPSKASSTPSPSQGPSQGPSETEAAEVTVIVLLPEEAQ